jgi:hypothetical protein
VIGARQAIAAELRELCRTLTGTGKFHTLEEQLDLELVGNSKGHVLLNGHLLDQAGGTIGFLFQLKFDQTDLANTIRETR